jgi:antitoxin component of RelBE/YafQ-DinJ toxin-antitoxin module
MRRMEVKTARLEIRLEPKERELAGELARRYGTTVSDLMRLLIRAAAANPSFTAQPILVLDKRTLAQYVRNVRALGHLLNQSTHALNAIAKAVRESGVDALDLTEAMEGVSYSLAEVRRDADAVRQQAGRLTGMPLVFQ